MYFNWQGDLCKHTLKLYCDTLMLCMYFLQTSFFDEQYIIRIIKCFIGGVDWLSLATSSVAKFRGRFENGLYSSSHGDYTVRS